MNTPGESAGNWQWRMLPGEASEELAAKIRRMTENYDRCAKLAPVVEQSEEAETSEEE